MKMYTNEIDFVIADNVNEAVEIAAKLYGSYEPFEDCEWDTMPEEMNFTYRDMDGIDTVKTVAEWIKERGKGYFANSEY